MTSRDAHLNFWRRLREFAQQIRIDSVKIGPASIRFDARAATDDCFSAITAKLVPCAGRANDVLVLSAHNLDEVTVVDAISADHECEALMPPERHPGGSGANTAYILGLLGAKVEVAGSVGGDPEGDLLLSSLKEAGVGVDLIHRLIGQPSGRTQNIVDLQGRRLLVVQPNSNDRFAFDASEDALVHAATAARILHLTSFADDTALSLQTRVAGRAAEETVVTLTPGALYARRGLDRLENLIRNVDLMFLYREQLAALIEGSSARSLLAGDGRTKCSRTLDGSPAVPSTDRKPW